MGFFSDLWEGVKGVFKAVTKLIGDFFKDPIKAIKDAVDRVINTVNNFFKNIKELNISDPFTLLGYTLTEAMGALGLPKEAAWMGMMAIMFWNPAVFILVGLATLAAPDQVIRGMTLSILQDMEMAGSDAQQEVSTNAFESNFTTHAWYPGSAEWSEVMPGGELFNSTGLIEPWLLMTSKDHKVPTDGLTVTNYFASAIPGAPKLSFPGTESFFKGV